MNSFEKEYEMLFAACEWEKRRHEKNMTELHNRFPVLLRAKHLGELWIKAKPNRNAVHHINPYCTDVMLYLRFAPSDAIPNAILFLEEHSLNFLELSPDLVYNEGRLTIIFDVEDSEHCRVEYKKFSIPSEERKIICL